MNDRKRTLICPEQAGNTGERTAAIRPADGDAAAKYNGPAKITMREDRCR